MKSRTAGDAAVLVYTVLGQLTELKDGLSSSVGQLHQLTMAAALAIVVVEVLSLGADGRRFETATDRWSRFLNILYAVSQALQAKLFFSPQWHGHCETAKWDSCHCPSSCVVVLAMTLQRCVGFFPLHIPPSFLPTPSSSPTACHPT